MESQRTSENKIAPQEQWMSISWFDDFGLEFKDKHDTWVYLKMVYTHLWLFH